MDYIFLLVYILTIKSNSKIRSLIDKYKYLRYQYDIYIYILLSDQDVEIHRVTINKWLQL